MKPHPTGPSSNAPNQTKSEAPFPLWSIMIGLVVACCLAFAPIGSNGFVNIDDKEGFVENPHIQGLTGANLRWALTSTLIDAYQPLPRVLYQAEWSAWGLNPAGFHLMSLALHAAVTLALFLLTRKLLRIANAARPETRLELFAAALAAGMFALHPMRVEVVAWAICQAYLPCALLSILSILASIKSSESSGHLRVFWMTGSLGLFTLALCCYQIPIGLPIILLLLDVYPLRRFDPQQPFGKTSRLLFLEKAPFLILSLIFGCAAIVARRRDVGFSALLEGGIGSRFAQAAYAVFFYPIKSLVPVGLCHVYPLRGTADPLEPRFVLSLVAFVAISGTLFAIRRRWPALAICWIGYLAILAPNSGLVRNIGVLAADRYGYLSTAVFVPLLAAMLARFLASGRAFPKLTMAAILLCLLTLVALTRTQCFYWRDSVSLWNRAIAMQPKTEGFFEGGLGLALADEERWAEAKPHLQAVVLSEPGFVHGRNKLGLALAHGGDFLGAETQFRESVRLAPTDVEARLNLGYTLNRLGRREDAAQQFAELVRRHPDLAEAHANLGAVRSEQKRFKDAEFAFREVVRLRPDRASDRMDLGFSLVNQGKFAEAVDQYSEAVRLDPKDPDARHNLGFALSRVGRLPDAVARYTEALRLKPDHLAARRGLAEIQRFAQRKIRAN